jgi:hypothetical protein
MYNVWLALAVLVFAGVFLWGYLDQNHCFPHSKVARITSRASDDHHSKECAPSSAKSAQPVLECADGNSEVTQTVPVRF